MKTLPEGLLKNPPLPMLASVARIVWEASYALCVSVGFARSTSAGGWDDVRLEDRNVFVDRVRKCLREGSWPEPQEYAGLVPGSREFLTRVALEAALAWAKAVGHIDG